MAVDPLVKLVEVNEKFATDANDCADLCETVSGDFLATAGNPILSLEQQVSQGRLGAPLVSRDFRDLPHRCEARASFEFLILLHLFVHVCRITAIIDVMQRSRI